MAVQANAQTGLSLRWAHTPNGTFSWAPAKLRWVVLKRFETAQNTESAVELSILRNRQLTMYPW